MKTLNERIQDLRNILVTCYKAIKEKGGSIPEEGKRNMTNLPAAVRSIPQEHNELVPLEVTANGDYLPADYDADGFSKVTAIFDLSSLNKVKLPGLGVNNSCIVNGYWAAELVDVSLISNFRQTFLDCRDLKTIDVSDWNMSNATATYMMFRNCNNLQYLDVSNWDVSKVVNMQQMFSPCPSLKILDVSKWDVSSVNTMVNMFNGCTSLEVLDVSKWDVKPETDITGMFAYCSKVEVLDVGHFDVSQKTTLTNIFMGCNSLKELNISNWDVSNATSLQGLFYEGAFCDLDLHLWDTKNVINMKQTFGNSTPRKWLNISGWNASNVTDCYAMFFRCENLTTFVGDNTLEDVINKDIKVLDGFRISSNNWQLPSINAASIRALINGLADLTGQTSQTLTIGDSLTHKFTEEDIAIATAKNWSIS